MLPACSGLTRDYKPARQAAGTFLGRHLRLGLLRDGNTMAGPPDFQCIQSAALGVLMPSDPLGISYTGQSTVIPGKLDHLTDTLLAGRFDTNPVYARTTRAGQPRYGLLAFRFHVQHGAHVTVVVVKRAPAYEARHITCIADKARVVQVKGRVGEGITSSISVSRRQPLKH